MRQTIGGSWLLMGSHLTDPNVTRTSGITNDPTILKENGLLTSGGAEDAVDSDDPTVNIIGYESVGGDITSVQDSAPAPTSSGRNLAIVGAVVLGLYLLFRKPKRQFAQNSRRYRRRRFR